MISPSKPKTAYCKAVERLGCFACHVQNGWHQGRNSHTVYTLPGPEFCSIDLPVRSGVWRVAHNVTRWLSTQKEDVLQLDYHEWESPILVCKIVFCILATLLITCLLCSNYFRRAKWQVKALMGAHQRKCLLLLQSNYGYQVQRYWTLLERQLHHLTDDMQKRHTEDV